MRTLLQHSLPVVLITYICACFIFCGQKNSIAQERFRINVTSKGIALVGGALTLLDYATTVVISASTASMYLAGEIVLPFPIYVGALIFLLIPLTISLLGLKESARTAFGIMVLHVRAELTRDCAMLTLKVDVYNGSTDDRSTRSMDPTWKYYHCCQLVSESTRIFIRNSSANF